MFQEANTSGLPLTPAGSQLKTPHTALDGDCHWVSCGSARPLRTAMATCRHPRSLIREPRPPSPSAGTHSRSGSPGGLPGRSQFTGSKQGRAAHTGLGGALAPHSPSGARASAHAHRPACGALNSAPLQGCSLASAQDRPQGSSHGHALDRPRPPQHPRAQPALSLPNAEAFRAPPFAWRLPEAPCPARWRAWPPHPSGNDLSSPSLLRQPLSPRLAFTSLPPPTPHTVSS